MPSASEQREIAEDRAAAWFAVRIILGGLLIHHILGTVAAIMFLSGWWWGETFQHPVPGEDDP
jgi:hypothetical protein